MNEESIKEILARMGKQKVETPALREQMRGVLLRAHKRPSYTGAITSNLYAMKKFTVPAGTFVGLVLAVMLGISAGTTPIAEAQELVQRSMTRAYAIPAEMRAQIEAQMKADMLDTLEEAHKAPDLKILTQEEYEKDAQFTFSKGPQISTAGGGMNAAFTVAAEASLSTSTGVVHFEKVSGHTSGSMIVESSAVVGGQVSTGHFEQVSGEAIGVATAGVMVAGPGMEGGFSSPVKYLKYTDPDGRKVVLGLDENDTPVMKIVQMIESDVQQVDGTHIQIMGKDIKMLQGTAEISH